MIMLPRMTEVFMIEARLSGDEFVIELQDLMPTSRFVFQPWAEGNIHNVHNRGQYPEFISMTIKTIQSDMWHASGQKRDLRCEFKFKPTQPPMIDANTEIIRYADAETIITDKFKIKMNPYEMGRGKLYINVDLDKSAAGEFQVWIDKMLETGKLKF